MVLAELYEEIIKDVEPVMASKWFRRDVLASCNEAGIEPGDLKITTQHLVDWFSLLNEKKVSAPILKELLVKVIRDDLDVMSHVNAEGLEAVDDDSELERGEQGILVL